MDLRFFDQLGSLRKNFSNHRSKVLKTLQPWLGLLLLLGLGHSLVQWITRGGVQDWLEQSPPKPSVWVGVIHSLGLIEVKEQKKLDRLYRLMPTTTDQQGACWTSQDQNWIALFDASAAPTGIRFFEKPASSLSPLLTQWSRLERTWRGIVQLDQKRSDYTTKHPAPLKKKASTRSPFEIRY